MRLRENFNISSIEESSTTVDVSTEETITETSESSTPCQFFSKDQINCSSEVYSDPVQWRLSREYFDQQIQILRVQLREMKVIRRHLREMKPLNKFLTGKRQPSIRRHFRLDRTGSVRVSQVFSNRPEQSM